MPVFLRPSSLLLVFVGGSFGTLLRELVQLGLGPQAGIPIATSVVNVAGALLLGVLLEALTRRGADEGAWQRTRLLLGTGLLGGFTTYSAVAESMALMLREGSGGLAIAYGLGTVLCGGLASWCGILIGARLGSPAPDTSAADV